ncbi:hypothetical protein IMCC20628_04408 [Hoeflea sp. IMCC20628]|uniref:hypothetical protein n=1 Tax=Hoeflea sp. IMCC20628 TaxID=1620421 RepID=UPI00063ABFA4|nr:hypothetical protein [Hoeflea sp. IMCC20628]AKI03081.1 hypothetical protein IMCC20628_04408 [Hoeflea sp. IMCC20628]
MVEYNPRPVDPSRPGERIHETTVVRSSNNNGVIAAIILFIVLAIGAFAYFSTDDARMESTTTPAPAVSEQVAPDPDAAQPVPAPDAPVEIAPAAPAANDAAPAPAVNP